MSDHLWAAVHGSLMEALAKTAEYHKAKLEYQSGGDGFVTYDGTMDINIMATDMEKGIRAITKFGVPKHVITVDAAEYADIKEGKLQHYLGRERGYAVGDVVRFEILGYTGDYVEAEITYISKALYGVDPDYCILSLKLLP